MADQLSLQTDPVLNGIQALKGCRQLLAVLSADKVWPDAVMQLDELGDKFPVSGSAAKEVNGYLQRCNNITINDLFLSVGWRKGDTAARMAVRAGGQAAALLSLCLSNLYSDVHAGEIIHRVSYNLLSREYTISSAEHLRDAVKVLADKLACIGYGNFLSAVVKMVASAYEELNEKWTGDVTDKVTADVAVELLTAVSRALHDEDTIVRVTGTQGMGYILGMILFLFPEDAMITVQGVVIFESIRRKILLDVRPTGLSLSTIEIHKRLDNPAPITLPIKVDRTSRFGDFCRFHWQGWVKERLEQRYWAAEQKPGNPEILESCCELLIALGRSLECGHTTGGSRKSGAPLLVSVTLDRMRQVCRGVFGTDPPHAPKDCNVAFKNLHGAFEGSQNLICDCSSGSSSLDKGWPRFRADDSRRQNCVLHQLWDGLGRALNDGFACFFIEAGPNVTVVEGESTFATDSITKSLKGQYDWTRPSHKVIWDMVFGLQKTFVTDAIGVSTGSCTLYPTVLETLQVPSEWHLGFRLVEGQFVFENEYFSRLNSCQADKKRSRVRCNGVDNLPDIIPSNNGVHQYIYPTYQKRVGFLELRMTARIRNIEMVLDMRECCRGFFELGRTDRCRHYPNTETMLDRRYLPNAVPTCVESPCTVDTKNSGKIAIAMTKGNPTAQLLCCKEGCRAILMKDCCLTCAFEQSRQQNFELVIVS